MAKEAAEMLSVDTARSAFHAFSTGDLAVLNEFYTQDVVWYLSGEVQRHREVHGRAAIID
jgi:ketosteroid isomerase-like protein